MVTKPRLLDLFCGAGGCSVGYARAGFDVVGVDYLPQPRYPFEFVRRDAQATLEKLIAGGCIRVDMFTCYRLQDFAAIHASPPCQGYSRLKHINPSIKRSYLVPSVRELLSRSGLPFVIENVVGAPLDKPAQICGSAFGLGVRRHRLFESNLGLRGTKCNHAAQGQPICVAGTGGRRVNRRVNNRGGACHYPVSIAQAQEVMGIDWMTRKELSQAIPPAYTEFIGRQLLQAIESRQVA